MWTHVTAIITNTRMRSSVMHVVLFPRTVPSRVATGLLPKPSIPTRTGLYRSSCAGTWPVMTDITSKSFLGTRTTAIVMTIPIQARPTRLFQTGMRFPTSLKWQVSRDTKPATALNPIWRAYSMDMTTGTISKPHSAVTVPAVSQRNHGGETSVRWVPTGSSATRSLWKNIDGSIRASCGQAGDR